jgi:hypothetical protein
MSTTASPQPPVTATDTQEIRIVSHSGLFYWWPVWAVGFIMASVTWWGDYKMAVVPSGSEARENLNVEGLGRRDVIVLPEGKKLLTEPDTNVPLQPKRWMASNSTPGVLWAGVLLLVIVITNVPLRGLWSVVVIVTVILLSIIFGLAGWWDHIFHALYLLDIRINMGGYITISLVLFALWLVTVLVFDKQIYMIFTPGQLRVCLEIGGGEKSFDTMGMVIEKHRDDLFRHWILGLGSGDLTVTTSGAERQTIHLHNVLFVGHKLRMIEEMQRDRPVVRGG